MVPSGLEGNMSEFRTRTETSGAVSVSPAGRLDTKTAPELREHLHQLVREGHTELIVDLSEVEAIDSAGLSALVSGLRVARQAGGRLRIARPSKQVAAILRLTNLHHVLGLQASADTGRDDSS